MEVEAVTDEYVYADRIFGDAVWWLRSSPFVPVPLALGSRPASSTTCIALPSASPRPT